jgi:hypothetical protein
MVLSGQKGSTEQFLIQSSQHWATVNGLSFVMDLMLALIFPFSFHSPFWLAICQVALPS